MNSLIQYPPPMAWDMNWMLSITCMLTIPVLFFEDIIQHKYPEVRSASLYRMRSYTLTRSKRRMDILAYLLIIYCHLYILTIKMPYVNDFILIYIEFIEK